MSSTSSPSIFSVPANPSEPSEPPSPGPSTQANDSRPRRTAQYSYFTFCDNNNNNNNNNKTPLLWSVMAYAAGATYPGSIIRTSASDCRPRDAASGIGRFLGSLKRDRRHSWVFVRRACDQPAMSPGVNFPPIDAAGATGSAGWASCHLS
ncbi:hypothetical protein ESCO_003755 [Escovopsis weberi]|uniref:Uncharacterized protein n=1 Tax=Escovopsis weberi TaxID=150374 RepID=A0A0N0RU95_ESCWE|nr:hypothetical protein ESCO_003755 [Escovopsis weberi]